MDRIDGPKMEKIPLNGYPWALGLACLGPLDPYSSLLIAK